MSNTDVTAVEMAEMTAGSATVRAADNGCFLLMIFPAATPE